MRTTDNRKENGAMSVNERLGLVAPCGIDCGVCELNMCKDNPQLLEHMVSRGIPREKLPCKGCRSVKGNCPVLSETCATYACATEKKVELCFQCGDFPCPKLSPAADRAAVLPHNLKVFNLCTIQRLGVERFVNESTAIKQRYFAGKMFVGKGPAL
jgi:hypothetical protein